MSEAIDADRENWGTYTHCKNCGCELYTDDRDGYYGFCCLDCLNEYEAGINNDNE